jgi:hypothetical protein
MADTALLGFILFLIIYSPTDKTPNDAYATGWTHLPSLHRAGCAQFVEATGHGGASELPFQHADIEFDTRRSARSFTMASTRIRAPFCKSTSITPGRSSSADRDGAGLCGSARPDGICPKSSPCRPTLP